MLKGLSVKTVVIFGLLIVVSIASFIYNTAANSDGTEKTLQSFYEEHTGQRDQLFEEIAGKENKAVVPSTEIVDNELILTYTFKKQLSDKEVEENAKRYEENFDDLNKSGSRMIRAISDKTNIPAKRITMNLRYLNKDGSEIWSHSFTISY